MTPVLRPSLSFGQTPLFGANLLKETLVHGILAQLVCHRKVCDPHANSGNFYTVLPSVAEGLVEVCFHLRTETTAKQRSQQHLTSKRYK